MKEIKLKEYFEDKVSAEELARDLKNCQEKTGYDTTFVNIETIKEGGFEIEKIHLIKLCDDFLGGEITNEELNTIGIALMFSDYFYWDNSTRIGERISEVISDWDNEKIGYDITKKNVQLWKEYLEEGRYALDKNELKQKFRNKGEYKKLYLEIDEILWNEWDPIGINDSAPRDEYQSYTPTIFSLKKRGANEDEIANKLHEIETNTIGVFGNIENCKKVARKIIELNEK
jgi:hypothetical protein